MSADFGEEYELQKAIVKYLVKKNCRVNGVEAGSLPLREGGTMLCINFTSDVGGVHADKRRIEELVRWLLVYLVRKGVTKTYTVVQAASIAMRTCDNKQQILRCKYWCNADKLRELEGVRFRILRPLSKMPLERLISEEFIELLPERNANKSGAVLSQVALPLSR